MEVVRAAGGPRGVPACAEGSLMQSSAGPRRRSLHTVDDCGTIAVTVLPDAAAGLLGGRRSPPVG